MGKRSNFERIERDYYPTPFEALEPLNHLLFPKTKFAEPMAGNGQLANNLLLLGHECKLLSDIEPSAPFVDKMDAFDPRLPELIEASGADYIITNPPWDRDILHNTIQTFRSILPTWLLFDADWVHTIQSIEYVPYCHLIQPVGRVKWFPDSSSTGKDNCAWHLFLDIESEKGGPTILPRQQSKKRKAQ